MIDTSDPDNTGSPLTQSDLLVLDAVAHIESRSCVRFQSCPGGACQASEIPYVRFVRSTTQKSASGVCQKAGAGSGVCDGEGMNVIKIGDTSASMVVFLLLRTLGMAPETSRLDRDAFVEIDLAQVKAGSTAAFEQTGQYGRDLGPYDYGSIMHFGKWEYSDNGGETVVTPQDIGQKKEMTDIDAHALNFVVHECREAVSQPVCAASYNEGLVHAIPYSQPFRVQFSAFYSKLFAMNLGGPPSALTEPASGSDSQSPGTWPIAGSIKFAEGRITATWTPEQADAGKQFVFRADFVGVDGPSTSCQVTVEVANAPHSCFGYPSASPAVCMGKGTCQARDTCVCTGAAGGVDCGAFAVCPVNIVSSFDGAFGALWSGNRRIESQMAYEGGAAAVTQMITLALADPLASGMISFYLAVANGASGEFIFRNVRDCFALEVEAYGSLYFNKAASINNILVETLMDDTYVFVMLRADFAAQTVDVYVDGQKKLSAVAFANQCDSIERATLRNTATGNPDPVLYLDEFRMLCSEYVQIEVVGTLTQLGLRKGGVQIVLTLVGGYAVWLNTAAGKDLVLSSMEPDYPAASGWSVQLPQMFDASNVAVDNAKRTITIGPSRAAAQYYSPRDEYVTITLPEGVFKDGLRPLYVDSSALTLRVPGACPADHNWAFDDQSTIPAPSQPSPYILDNTEKKAGAGSVRVDAKELTPLPCNDFAIGTGGTQPKLVSFYLRMAAASAEILVHLVANWVSEVTVTFTSAQLSFLKKGSAAEALGTLPLNAWFKVEVEFDWFALAIALRVDGQDKALTAGSRALSADLTNIDAVRVCLGQDTNQPAQPRWMDELAVQCEVSDPRLRIDHDACGLPGDTSFQFYIFAGSIALSVADSAGLVPSSATDCTQMDAQCAAIGACSGAGGNAPLRAPVSAGDLEWHPGILASLPAPGTYKLCIKHMPTAAGGTEQRWLLDTDIQVCAPPSLAPSVPPSIAPSLPPTVPPSQISEAPTVAPSAPPSAPPSAQPSEGPSAAPSGPPSLSPTTAPQGQPTPPPSHPPSLPPSGGPSPVPTAAPTAPPQAPTAPPTAAPSQAGDTAAPTAASRCASVRCPPSDQCHTAGACDEATGLCSDPVAPNGTACDDGDPATTGDACVSGACHGTIQCGGAACGVFDPQCTTAQCAGSAGGLCGSRLRADGYKCNDQNAATQNDTCVKGWCQGVADKCAGVLCTVSDQCHAAGVCDAATGLCSDPAAADGTACDDGDNATATDVCTKGVCAGTAKCGGVTCTVCDRRCARPACTAATGECFEETVADGAACNDDNPETFSDHCAGGSCVGIPNRCAGVVCVRRSHCHQIGACNNLTGLCSQPPAADGSACDDNLAETAGDRCAGGVCLGALPCVSSSGGANASNTTVQCAASGSGTHDARCNAPTCVAPGTNSSASGGCGVPAALADGTRCSDGRGETKDDACAGGMCLGVPDRCSGVRCVPPNNCHSGGQCDADTGKCVPVPLADGAACSDGDNATAGDRCVAGTCAGTLDCSGKVCTTAVECFRPACGDSPGTCVAKPRPDCEACSDGSTNTSNDMCRGGVCRGVFNGAPPPPPIAGYADVSYPPTKQLTSTQLAGSAAIEIRIEVKGDKLRDLGDLSVKCGRWGDPDSGVWLNGTRDSVIDSCSARRVDDTTLLVSFKHSGDLVPSDKEVVKVTLQPGLLQSGVSPDAAAAFALMPKQAAGLNSAVVQQTPPVIPGGQSLAVLTMGAQCPDDGPPEDLAIMLHPTRLELGGGQWAQYHGAVVMNTAILVALAVLCTVLTMRLRCVVEERLRQRKAAGQPDVGDIPSARVLEAARWGCFLQPVTMMYPGCVLTAVSVLIYSDTVGFRVFSAFVLLACVALPVLNFVVIRRVTTFAAFEPCVPDSKIHWAFFGSEEWVAAGDWCHHRLHHLMYDAYRFRDRYFNVYLLSFNLIIAILQSFRAANHGECMVQNTIVAVLVTGHALYMCIRMVHVAPYDNFFENSAAVAEAVVVIFILITIAAEKGQSGYWATDAAGAIASALTFVLGIKAILDISIFMHDEYDHWTTLEAGGARVTGVRQRLVMFLRYWFTFHLVADTVITAEQIQEALSASQRAVYHKMGLSSVRVPDDSDSDAEGTVHWRDFLARKGGQYANGPDSPGARPSMATPDKVRAMNFSVHSTHSYAPRSITGPQGNDLLEPPRGDRCPLQGSKRPRGRTAVQGQGVQPAHRRRQQQQPAAGRGAGKGDKAPQQEQSSPPARRTPEGRHGEGLPVLGASMQGKRRSSHHRPPKSPRGYI